MRPCASRALRRRGTWIRSGAAGRGGRRPRPEGAPAAARAGAGRGPSRLRAGGAPARGPSRQPRSGATGPLRPFKARISERTFSRFPSCGALGAESALSGATPRFRTNARSGMRVLSLWNAHADVIAPRPRPPDHARPPTPLDHGPRPRGHGRPRPPTTRPLAPRPPSPSPPDRRAPRPPTTRPSLRSPPPLPAPSPAIPPQPPLAALSGAVAPQGSAAGRGRLRSAARPLRASRDTDRRSGSSSRS
jgi:hypothetical protein